MKILAIRIRNLASLAGSTSIDFTTGPLATAGVFAITGPTGSGKSTILDALCLALYARTPRYRLAETGITVRDVPGSEISQGDVRGILRDGTAEGYAEVDFVGVDQQRYRAKWSVRRAYNRAEGSLQQYEIALKNLSTSRDISGRKSELQGEIERLVGLNFEQFTRSVLLAQGDFTAFLKANKDEKASLLEKLTGTQIYSEISRRIFERHRAENQLLGELNIKRGEIPVLTTEELAEFGRQKEELEKQALAADQAINLLTVEISWYEQMNLLQIGRKEAYDRHEEAVKGRLAAIGRIGYLQRVEAVQVVRPAVERLYGSREQSVEKMELLRHQLESLEELTTRQETIDRGLHEAQLDLTKKSEELDEAQPGLDKAKVLDVKLVEKAKQLGLAGEELQVIMQRHQELKQTLDTRKKEAIEADSTIVRLNEWQKQNASRQAVVDNESLILSRLQDAAALLEKQRTVATTLRQLEQEKNGLESEGKKLKVREEKKKAEWQKAQEEYDRNHAVLKELSLDFLEQEKSLIDAALVELSEATTHWELLRATQQEMERIVAKQGEQEQGLERARKDLTHAQSELATARIQREASRKALETVQLAASEGVEEMRAKLVANEPCPVCGSKDHPFALENPQLDRVLVTLTGKFQEDEQIYLKWLQEQGRQQQVVAHLQEEIESMQKDLAVRGTGLQELEKAWAACPVHTEAIKEPAAGRTGWLQGRRRETLEKQAGLQVQLQNAHRLQQQVETSRNDRDRLEKELLKIRDAIKDNGRGLEVTREKQEQQKRELQEAGERVEGIEQQLGGYLSSDHWFAGWKSNSCGVEKEIRALVVEWKAKAQELEKILLKRKTLHAQIGNYEEQMVVIEADRKGREEYLGGLDQQNMELRGQRDQLFAGRPVATVEQELKVAVENARKALDASRVEKENLDKLVTRTTAEKAQTGTAITELHERQDRAEGEIREWLSKYNREQQASLSMEDLEKLMKETPDWRKEEQAALRELDDTVMRAQTVLAERAAALGKHLEHGKPEREAGELENLLAETRSGLQKMTKELNEIDFRLKEDAGHKEKIGELLKQIEAQGQLVENWAKLNEVIGSADGKKFRQVAQEYTLDVLLRFSNVHLNRLSSRYVLQRIPDTLGLQVVDQDMGDEVRTVYSLSGGESFLVSLSLALGLASLTSNRMQVESLFIDEGFGTLDPNTLNIAMDALERLHQEGRKVGVISHVQEMTERTPVQIRVSKERSGMSRVEIVGV
jgi:exonuclease SbcC